MLWVFGLRKLALATAPGSKGIDAESGARLSMFTVVNGSRSA
jgi:hypothetical protein